MGNASSQCPDALHPLGAEQFRFNPLSLSDVRVDYQDRLGASFVGSNVQRLSTINALTRFGNLGQFAMPFLGPDQVSQSFQWGAGRRAEKAAR